MKNLPSIGSVVTPDRHATKDIVVYDTTSERIGVLPQGAVALVVSHDPLQYYTYDGMIDSYEDFVKVVTSTPPGIVGWVYYPQLVEVTS